LLVRQRGCLGDAQPPCSGPSKFSLVRLPDRRRPREVGGTPSLLDGSYLDPRRAHVDGKATDALCFGSVGSVRTEQHAPVSLSSQLVHTFCPSTNVAVAARHVWPWSEGSLGPIPHRARSNPDTTHHRSDPWEESLALYGGGVMEQSRSNVNTATWNSALRGRVNRGSSSAITTCSWREAAPTQMAQ